jgi:hypothetical protein
MFGLGLSMDSRAKGYMDAQGAISGVCNNGDANAETVDGVHTKKEAYTVIDLGMYGTQDWGAATGMFGMGVTSTDNPNVEPAGGWADVATLVNTNFSVESTLTDWCDLRIGYMKSFNVSAADGETVSTDSYLAGLGFNYGSVTLDLTLADSALNTMFANPMSTITGYNNNTLTSTWTVSNTVFRAESASVRSKVTDP